MDEQFEEAEASRCLAEASLREQREESEGRARAEDLLRDQGEPLALSSLPHPPTLPHPKLILAWTVERRPA